MSNIVPNAAKKLQFSGRDLFGEEIVERRKPKENGYAAPPGTGPARETCKSCKHYAHRVRAKKYRKCGLMKAHWTGGPGTDILARSPACRCWEEYK